MMTLAAIAVPSATRVRVTVVAVQYTETHVSENDAGNFNITTYFDGELVSSQDTDLPYMTDAELRTEMASTTVGLDAAASPRTCLAAVLGISGFWAAIIK